jgi:AraC-like DNA-binding protein
VHLVPDGRTELLVHGRRRLRNDSHALSLHFVGQYQSPLAIPVDDGGWLVGLRLHTTGALRFIHRSPQRAFGRLLPLSDVGRRLSVDLLRELRRADSPLQALTTLWSVLPSCQHDRRDHLVEDVVQTVECGAANTLEAEAARLGVSVRTLERRIGSVCGARPALIRRLIRFRAAVLSLTTGVMPRWTSLAADCGYYDHAHLIRETREFAGLTPLQFWRWLNAPGAVAWPRVQVTGARDSVTRCEATRSMASEAPTVVGHTAIAGCGSDT